MGSTHEVRLIHTMQLRHLRLLVLAVEELVIPSVEVREALKAVKEFIHEKETKETQETQETRKAQEKENSRTEPT